MNTYEKDAGYFVIVPEELRLIRCLLERMLRAENEALFVDYQMEKFGKDYKTFGILDTDEEFKRE